MDIMEIVLLAIGGIVFILSFLIPAKKEENSEEARGLAKEEIKTLVSSELEAVRGHVDDVVEEAVTYSIEKTERSLERLSNEKIMAVNEYSDTVLAEIHKNHEEVMFLYDMLNDKHTNLKNTVSEIDRTVKEAKETKREAEEMVNTFQRLAPETIVPLETKAAEIPSQVLFSAARVPQTQQKSVTAPVPPQASAAPPQFAAVTAPVPPQTSAVPPQFAAVTAPVMPQTSAVPPQAPVAAPAHVPELPQPKAAEPLPVTVGRPAAPQVSKVKPAGKPAVVPEPVMAQKTAMPQALVTPQPFTTLVQAPVIQQPYIPQSPASGLLPEPEPPFTSGAVNFAQETDGQGRNYNDRILELYQEGKSNVAIARELNLGVGEVKLVIDLYKNRMRDSSH